MHILANFNVLKTDFEIQYFFNAFNTVLRGNPSEEGIRT